MSYKEYNNDVVSTTEIVKKYNTFYFSYCGSQAKKSSL